MTFSVIIPVRDDPAGLDVALAGLRQQLYPPDEVIIVNASEHPLAVQAHSTPPMRVTEAGPSFPGKARNAGARAARHEWIVFLDAGACPTPGWLDSFRAVAEKRPEAQVIYGCFLPKLRDEWDRAAAGVYLPPRAAPHVGSHPTTASLCVRRGLWQAAGGMPEGLRAGEDLVFFEEIEARAPMTAVASDALVVWDLPVGALGHHRRLRRYSAATWPTELARRWHWPLIRMYAAALVLVLATPILPPAALVALPALAAARIARNYRSRESGLCQALTPMRVLRLVAMTGLVDVAAFLGIWDSMVRRRWQ